MATEGGAFHRKRTSSRSPCAAGTPASPSPSRSTPRSSRTCASRPLAGRPSSSAFNISTVDNRQNHRPGTQGAKATKEADSCFARVLPPEEGGGEGIDVVKRMKGQPGGKGPNGFVSGRDNYIDIVSFKQIKASAE